jgi:hypothetical protein
MEDKETREIYEEMKELLSKSEVMLALDENGEIVGGFAKKDGRLSKLYQCEDLYNGKRTLEGLSPLTLVKVSSSPGHWCIIAGRLTWCP